MSRKHFTALALALKSVRPDTKGAALKAWALSVEAVATACAAENPNFDRTRFLSACGC